MEIRSIQESDVEKIAVYKVEISKISFGTDAITDIEFHKKKILKAMLIEKEGMLVLHDKNIICGWLWMSNKTNYLSRDNYINFKSFYIEEKYRGEKYTNFLLEKGIEFAYEKKAKYIVGKVNINNMPMRIVYKKFGFSATHLTMELKLGNLEDSKRNED